MRSNAATGSLGASNPAVGTANIRRSLWDSPIGSLGLVLRGSALATVILRAERKRFPEAVKRLYGTPGREIDRAFSGHRRQLREYFAGRRRDFDLELDWDQGTPFQQQVWRRLIAIPYGTTVSYGDIARDLGKPGASQAVGAANGANRIPILIPCHRVIQNDGRLGGFGGGVDMKRRLLALEGARPMNCDLFETA